MEMSGLDEAKSAVFVKRWKKWIALVTYQNWVEIPNYLLFLEIWEAYQRDGDTLPRARWISFLLFAAEEIS